LGDKFLRHTERTRILLHIIDPLGFGSVTPLKSISVISKELKNFSIDLSKKPKILVVNKSDLPQSREVFNKIKKKFSKQKVFLISAATGFGISKLLDEVVKELSKAPCAVSAKARLRSSLKIHRMEPAFKITRTGGGTIEITGAKIKSVIEKTNFEQPESIIRLKNILKKMGVDKELKKLGINKYDTVKVSGMEFVWQENYSDIDDRSVSRRKRKPLSK
jgi:GTP-binding protein